MVRNSTVLCSEYLTSLNKPLGGTAVKSYLKYSKNYLSLHFCRRHCKTSVCLLLHTMILHHWNIEHSSKENLAGLRLPLWLYLTSNTRPPVSYHDHDHLHSNQVFNNRYPLTDPEIISHGVFRYRELSSLEVRVIGALFKSSICPWTIMHSEKRRGLRRSVMGGPSASEKPPRLVAPHTFCSLLTPCSGIR